MPPPVVVRLARASDAGAVASIYAPLVDETAVTFETTPPDGAAVAERIGATLPTWPWLVADRGGTVLGFAHGAPHRTRAAYRWSVEVSVYVAADARGQGTGRRLYAALLALLTAQGYATALAGITQPNPASVALHQVLGFEPVAVYRAVGCKLGGWHDVGWWQRRLQSLPACPPLPVTVDALDDRTVRRCLRAPPP